MTRRSGVRTCRITGASNTKACTRASTWCGTATSASWSTTSWWRRGLIQSRSRWRTREWNRWRWRREETWGCGPRWAGGGRDKKGAGGGGGGESRGGGGGGGAGGRAPGGGGGGKKARGFKGGGGKT